MKMNRVFAFPKSDTFDCIPIGAFVKRYLRQSSLSIDPFARNKLWATYTNDLNPDTLAEHHMDAHDFLVMLLNQDILADLIIFDPPYSPRQIKECYDSIGLTMKSEDAWRTAGWRKEKALANQLLKPNGIFLYFGWDTNGMNSTGENGFIIEEILLVNHGLCHNDTICMAERKLAHQAPLF